MQGGEGLHADHVVHDSCCIRVVCAIVEFVNGSCWVFKALIPIDSKKDMLIDFKDETGGFAIGSYAIIQAFHDVMIKLKCVGVFSCIWESLRFKTCLQTRNL